MVFGAQSLMMCPTINDVSDHLRFRNLRQRIRLFIHPISTENQGKISAHVSEWTSIIVDNLVDEVNKTFIIWLFVYFRLCL